MNRQRLTMMLVITVLTALLTAPAMARHKAKDGPNLPPTKQEITCVGFTANNKEVVFKVVDENIGTLFQVRSVKHNKVVASFPYNKGGEKSAWRRVKKAHKLETKFSDAPENTRKNVVMMSQVKGDQILIHMMRGDAIKPYLNIPLHKNKKGKPAEAFVKQMVWSAKGKVGVVVYHQSTVGRMKWEGDFVHAFKFKSYRVNFDGGAGE